MFPDTQMYMFSNVHMKLRNTKTHRVIKEIHRKNTITKYALNGIASMIKGEFTDTNYNKINEYVPKYLALGTNMPSQRRDNITVGTSITVFDDSLLSEILKNDKLIRIKLEEARRIDNLSTNEYVKIRFKTMVTSGTIGYSTAIQELGLFIDNKNLKGGLWARISTDPITIPENSVLDVIWDVVLASSIGVYPSKIMLFDASSMSISQSDIDLDYNQIYPITANLKSSVVDGFSNIVSDFLVSEDSEIIEGHEGYKYTSTNNFSTSTKIVEIFYDELESSDERYKIRYKYDNGNWEIYIDEYYNVGKYSSIDAAKSDASKVAHEAISPIDGEIIKVGDLVSIYEYKDVTYKNCTWVLENNDTEVTDYKTSESYEVGDFVIFDNSIYKCLTDTSGQFNPENWNRIATFIRYMTNCVVINLNETGSDIEFKLTATASSGISDYVNLNIKTNS